MFKRVVIIAITSLCFPYSLMADIPASIGESVSITENLGESVVTKRVSEISASEIFAMMVNPQRTYVLEFKTGDSVPVKFEADGDLFSTLNLAETQFIIKRDFFIKIKKNIIDISFDGKDYYSLQDALSGSLTASADLGKSGLPSLIKVLFSVFVK